VWESSRDGVHAGAFDTPDASGGLLGATTLSEGAHFLTLTVTDSVGNTSRADVTLDVGALYYYYPGAFYNGFSGKPNYNNLELYVGGVFGPFSAKFFYAISDFFGLNETTGGKSSSGSYYIDLNYATEILPKLTLAAHLGYQSVANYSNLTYTDYKIGVTYDYNSWLLGAAFIGTNAEKTPYTIFDSKGSSKFVAGNTVVFSVGKTF
jgi:uncharacterized protein (TIGR02001 family)